MQLLFCILNDPGKLNDVISALVEVGVRGATVIESSGMAKILSRDIPIFAGFRHLLQGAQPYNQTILSVVEEAKTVDEFAALLKDILKNEPKGSGAVLFTVPVTRFERIGPPKA